MNALEQRLASMERQLTTLRRWCVALGAAVVALLTLAAAPPTPEELRATRIVADVIVAKEVSSPRVSAERIVTSDSVTAGQLLTQKIHTGALELTNSEDTLSLVPQGLSLRRVRSGSIFHTKLAPGEVEVSSNQEGKPATANASLQTTVRGVAELRLAATDYRPEAKQPLIQMQARTDWAGTPTLAVEALFRDDNGHWTEIRVPTKGK